MADNPNTAFCALAQESVSTAAAAQRLNVETRAFGNAAAKLNLQQATAAFTQAKEALSIQPLPSVDSPSNDR